MEFLPDTDAVREEVERVAASEQFIRSRRLVRFLRFTVEKVLDGCSHVLTEHTLGIEVYDRDSTFDPLADGIVRTEAHRLRSKLREYYRGTGRSDSILIDYPLGSYVPEFHHAEPEFLPATGVVSSLLKVQDWSLTTLGSMATWPRSLKNALSLHLRSASPSAILWGPDLVVLFNDALYELLGESCRAILGRPFPESLDRDWPRAAPAARRVFQSGESFAITDDRWLMYRGTHRDEHYFATGFSPIMDADKNVAGVLILVTQTTQAVIRVRRGRVLQVLGERMFEPTSITEASHATMTALQLNPFDIPFAALYLFENDRQSAKLCGTTGIQPGLTVTPGVIEFRPGDSGYLNEAATSAIPQVLQVESRLGSLPLGPWSVPATELVVLPVLARGQAESTGFMVAAVNPHQKLDQEYRAFFESVAAQIGAMVTHARVQEQKVNLAEQSTAQERSQASFLTYISEEFRTPLTLLLGFLAQVMESSRLSGEHQSQLAVVRRNALRLLRLLSALIDLGTIEAGQMKPVFEPVDLGAFTSELAGTFRSVIEAAKLRFAVECPPTTESAYVDRLMWEKMVLYLLFHALQSTSEGEIGIAIRPAGGWIELVVWDTGSGIPVFELPQSFENRSRGGAALGVTLVRHFAAMHGGSVQVASDEGKGSKFTVSIPKGKAHLAAENIIASRGPGASITVLPAYIEQAFCLASKEDLAVHRGGIAPNAEGVGDWRRREFVPRARRRILVAVPDADLRSYCHELLSEVHTVQTVPAGEDLLEAVLREPPDLLLADTAMPRTNATGLLRAIRADARTRSLPVILVSAQSAEEDRLQAFAAGADDFIVKPFTTLELLVRVESQIMVSELRKKVETEQKAARQAAESQRLVMEAVIDQLPTAVLIAEVSSGKFIYKNKLAYQMLGEEVAHALRTLDDVRSDIGFRRDGTPYDREDCPIMRATKYGEIIVDEEIIYHLPEGRRLWVLSNSFPIRDGQGQHVATVVTLTEKHGVTLGESSFVTTI